MTSPRGIPLFCPKRLEAASRITPIASRSRATNRAMEIIDWSISTLPGEPDQSQHNEQEKSDEQKPPSRLAQAGGPRDRRFMSFVKDRAFLQSRTLGDFAAALEIPGLRAVDKLADFGSVDDQSPIDL